MKTKQIEATEYDGNFIEEVEPIYRGKRKDRRVKLNCTVCSKDFITSYDNSKRTRQLTCSNQCGGVITRKSIGGNTKNPNYARWLSMRDRCNNPSNNNYDRYGARGITYSKEFDDFTVYNDYINSLPGYNDLNTIDRIDNDKGYIRGNLRWANMSTQCSNKTYKDLSTSSKYIGVHYCNTHNSWISKIQHKGKNVFCKYYPNQEEAVKARNKFIIDKNLPHTVQSII